MDVAATYRSEAVRRAGGDPRLLASIYLWLQSYGDDAADEDLVELLRRYPQRWPVREAVLKNLVLPLEASRCLDLVKEAVRTGQSQLWKARCHAHRGERAEALSAALLAHELGLGAGAFRLLALELARFEPSFEAAWRTVQATLAERVQASEQMSMAEVELADEWGMAERLRNLLEAADSSWLAGYELREGVWRVHAGQPEQGIALLQAALMEAPEDPDRLNALAFTLVEQGYHAREPEVLLRRAYRLDSEAGYILDSLGWLFWKRGDWERAAQWLHAALRLRPDDPEVMFHLAQVERASGRVVEARLYLKRALELAPMQRLRVSIEKTLSEVADEQSR